MKNELKIIILIVFLVAFLFSTSIFYFLDYSDMNKALSHVNDEIISFNKKSGFYDKTIKIKLSKSIDMPSGVKIYYTLNGDDPTKDSMEYKNGIKLNISDDIVLYPIKVVAYYKGEYSKIIENDYILGKNIENNFDLNVISITSDSYNLYDYYKGIMVPGATWDVYKKQGFTNYKRGNYNNRGEDWIRNAHMIMFDKSGDELVNQSIGVGISGSSTAALDVKSLKIYSDKKYDDRNYKFNLDLYDYSSSEQSFLYKYNSLRLRSGGQDSYKSNIRAGIISKLANESGFDGVSTSTRSIVYLNGEFYGIFDIQQNYSSSYLKNKYGLNSSDMIEKHRGKESQVFQNAKIADYFTLDLDKKENRKLLEQYVDMDNYLLYYAINILANNTDWPQHNFEVWKYTGNHDKNNKYTDGKYRFLIYDVDLIYTTAEKNESIPGMNKDVLVSLMENLYSNQTNSTFINVMNSKYYRDKFITIISDLLNTSFKKENVEKIVNLENDKIQKSLKLFYNETYILNQKDKVEVIKKSVIEKDESIRKDIEKYFDVYDKYHLSIKTDDGVSLIWNNMKVYQNDSYENDYYNNVQFEIQKILSPNYKFDYWLVNGEKRYENSLEINDELIVNGKIEIEVFSKKINSECLIISEISAKGDSDWIKISNVSDNDIDISNYFISDKKNNLSKYRLPNVVLKNKQSIVINGKNHYYSKGDYISNFKLQFGETIYLSKDDEIVDKIYVPRMTELDSYGRYNGSNIYMYFYNKDDVRKKN